MSLVLATASTGLTDYDERPMLPFTEYVKERGYKLNAECVNVFYNRIKHLKEQDFVEIDRTVLEAFGYANTFKVVKINGVAKLDSNGNQVLIDGRSDFTTVIRYLRTMKSFTEGTSLDDINADYVLVPDLTSRGGKKNLLYVKKEMLEHLCIMSNSPNSRIIREYFLELYRAVNDYIDYQKNYQNMMVIANQRNLLRFKDSRIDELSMKMDRQSEHMLHQSKQIENQSEQIAQLLGYSKKSSNQLSKVVSLVERTKNDVVVPANNDVLQEIVIIMVSTDKQFYVVSCVQKRNRKVTIRNNQMNNADKNLTVACIIEHKPNAKNVLHRFKEYVVENELTKEIKLSGTSFTLSDDCDLTTEQIVSVFQELSKIHHDRVSVMTVEI